MSIWGDIASGLTAVAVTPDWSSAVWGWIQDDRDASLDDDGPLNLREFEADMRARLHRERVFGFALDGQPIGVIGVCPVTDRTAMLHGVLFDRSVHGSGLPQAALRDVLDTLWSEGIVKVSAGYFADNVRVRKFLAKLGAVDEGYLRAQTMRDGKPVDMRLVAFFQE